MGRNNRIEFNDFDGDDKRKDAGADLVDDDVDADVIDIEDASDDEPVAEYRHLRPKKSLFDESENADDIRAILGSSGIYSSEESVEFDGVDGIDDIDDIETNVENLSPKDVIETDFDEVVPQKKKAVAGTSKAEAKKQNIQEKVAAEEIVAADFDDDEDDMFNPRNRKEKRKIQKRTAIVLCSAGGILLTVIIALIIIVMSIANQSTVYSGVSLYGKDLGGMTQKEVADYINEMYIDPIKNADVTVVLEGKEYIYPMTDFIECPDADEKAKEAHDIKREGGFFERFVNILRLKKSGQEISLVYNFIDTSLDAVMNNAESESFSDPVDPTYIVKSNIVSFTPGKTGTKIDKNAFEKDLLSSLSDYEKEMSNLGSGESLKNIRIEATVATVKFKQLDSDRIYNETLTPPVDAYCYKISAGKIGVREAVSGRGLEKDRLIEVVAKINNCEATLVEDVPFVTVWANKSAADVRDSLYRNELSSGYVENTVDVIAVEEGEEPIDDKALRAENLQLIASKLNGYEILDGDVLNFTEIIGTMSSSKGFVYARENINGSGRVLGGGASMAATALYAAAMKYSGFNIREVSHSEFLPYYGQPGFDAYINQSSGKNLVIVNNTGAPIKVTAEFDGEGFYVSFAGNRYDRYKSYALGAELVSEEADGTYITYTYKISLGEDSLLEENVVYKESHDGMVPDDSPTETPDGTLDPDATVDPDATADPSATPDADETTPPVETTEPSGEPEPSAPTPTPTTDPAIPTSDPNVEG